MSRVRKAELANMRRLLASILLIVLPASLFVSCASCPEPESAQMPSREAAARNASPCCGHEDIESCLHLPLIAQVNDAAFAEAPVQLGRTEVPERCWRAPIVGLGFLKPEAAAGQGIPREGPTALPLPALRL